MRKGGFEPPCLSAPPPQDGVSASSTTSALSRKCFVFNCLLKHLQAVTASSTTQNARLPDSTQGCTSRIVVLMVSWPRMYCNIKASVCSPASIKNA